MNSNRRQLIAKWMRVGLLGVIASVTGYSIIKRRRLIREGKCINKSICCDCSAFGECNLPAALSAKQNGVKHGR